jgi:hypothetical protein
VHCEYVARNAIWKSAHGAPAHHGTFSFLVTNAVDPHVKQMRRGLPCAVVGAGRGLCRRPPSFPLPILGLPPPAEALKRGSDPTLVGRTNAGRLNE